MRGVRQVVSVGRRSRADDYYLALHKVVAVEAESEQLLKLVRLVLFERLEIGDFLDHGILNVILVIRRQEAERCLCEPNCIVLLDHDHVHFLRIADGESVVRQSFSAVLGGVIFDCARAFGLAVRGVCGVARSIAGRQVEVISVCVRRRQDSRRARGNRSHDSLCRLSANSGLFGDFSGARLLFWAPERLGLRQAKFVSSRVFF